MVWMPFGANALSAVLAVTPEDAAPGALRVLLVEDNPDAAETLADVLGFSGHEVRIATNGESALREAGEFRPDAVLLDIGLPDMDGCQVARQLRALPATARTLLVALTGYAREEDRVRTRDAGFDDHLVKPIDFDELERLLSSRRAKLVQDC